MNNPTNTENRLASARHPHHHRHPVPGRGTGGSAHFPDFPDFSGRVPARYSPMARMRLAGRRSVQFSST